MVGPNSNGNSEGRSSLESELHELLLLRQQRDRNVIRERDLNIIRSGSAPPTVEGAFSAIGGLFRNYPNGAITDQVLSEDEIRSHLAYLSYYYSHDHVNPRLPPPLLTREDWRVAQRVQAGGVHSGWRRRKNSMDQPGTSSLFTMQPGLSPQDDSGMGVRRKSFADIIQEGHDQSESSSAHLAHYATKESTEASHAGKAPPGFSGVKKVENPKPCAVNRSRTPEPHPVTRTPSPGLNGLSSATASFSGLNLLATQLHHDDNHSLYNQVPNGHTQGLLQHFMANDLTLDYNAHMNTFRPPSPNIVHSSEYASQKDYKKLQQVDRFQGVDIPGAYVYPQNSSLGSRLNGVSGNGWHLRSESSEANSSTHRAVMEPRGTQNLKKASIKHVAAFTDNPSHMVGASHGNIDLKGLENLYLEKLLALEEQQLKSSIQPNYGSLADCYYGNHTFGVGLPCQGNKASNSLLMTVGSRNPTFKNNPLAQIPSFLKNPVEESAHSWNSKSVSNMDGKFSPSLLDDLKNNRNRSLVLTDVVGRVLEFSTDQHGSRFIQQKLETASVEEKMKILPEILSHSLSLITDVFGNYVIQKFLEHGTESQRKELASQLIGHVLPLSLHMYGCRVIQKALEVIDVELQSQMVRELDGSVMKCVRDQNGNHVIQKCIERVSQDQIGFITTSFFGQVVSLSTHPYGCRVIQRILEQCDDQETRQIIMNEIVQAVCTLVLDQYGNYVVQHVLQHGKPNQRSVIIGKLSGQIVKLSQHKYASNVIEKCLVFASPEERQILVNEMLGLTDENEPLQAMMKDPFGNYVVQKVVETCDDQNRELILSRIKVHLNALKKYTYGKHIVSRVEKLIATGEKHMALSMNSY